MRGYLQKKNIEKEVLDTKLMNCHNFFKQVKNDYQDDAAVKMQYTIRRWLKSIKVAKQMAKDLHAKKTNHTAINNNKTTTTHAKTASANKSAPAKIVAQ